MFEVSVETSFTATHAVTIYGVEEEQHSHNWVVVLAIQGRHLDDDGLLVDFLDIEQQLANAVVPLHNANLNTSQEMKDENPTAERVAWYIASCINVTPPALILSVTVTEAPHCKATYRP
jgi:6-pyruvoyltetrahydropterin/6-carboxytetrahydropterin synthase